MAEYELVYEIKNLCRNNQMRDVFFEDVECDDPDSSFFLWAVLYYVHKTPCGIFAAHSNLLVPHPLCCFLL